MKTKKLNLLGLGASSNRIWCYIWHRVTYTPTRVQAHALVPLGPSFLNSLNAYDSSGYPLEMLPENICC